MCDQTMNFHFEWRSATDEELRRGYEAMAADADREREALEWSEALIGECL